ncbi:sensor histidine kinase [Jiella pelagia]|uniref:Blue-light-activated histidine kinase n=1 Tax=Jiella pelagia TaxID=2986949 RepID=A0ABY7C4L3_9HYPH|nr:HWE histidine kinase domain-containing protein [Jiella pelagia]WAP70146.1 PAS domain-containing protein [Jiella pelagia]
MKTLLEGIPQLVWRSRDDGDWTWASPQWEAFTGQSAEASLGSGWLDVVHPDDRDSARSAWSQSRDADGFHADYRIREAASGHYRWFQTRATPYRESDGTIIEWFGTSTDVDDLWRLREHERLLLAELQHRVRNTLAVIRSIARRTADTTETAEDYAMHLEGRINAFARVQAAVTRDPLGGVSLLDLVAEELIAATAREGENATIEGPNIRLSGREAETFGLAVHELATNAIKFGALSEPAGHVAIRWTIEEAADPPLLHFVWKETGVDLNPDEPRRRGFGTELLERTLSYQLLAEGRESFEADGVRCVIRMPLPMQMNGFGGRQLERALEED